PVISAGRIASVHRGPLTSGAASRAASGTADSAQSGVAAFAGNPSGASAGNALAPVLTLPGDWALAIFLAWYLIATALVVRLLVGHIRLQRIKEAATPLGAWHQSRLAEWLRISNGSRVP